MPHCHDDHPFKKTGGGGGSGQHHPLPFRIPVPPSSPPTTTTTTPPLLDDEAIVDRLRQMDIYETENFFNPYYYTADEPFQLEPKEIVTLFFDRVPDGATWNAYKTCLRKRHVFFVLQNISSTTCLRVPQGARLLDILIMDDIKSCIIPVTQSFSFLPR